MPACPLAEPQLKGHCHWCGRTLKGRQTRWCSRDCARAATANHRFTQARALAKVGAAYFLCARAHWFDANNDMHGGESDMRLIKPIGCEGMAQDVHVNHKVPCKGKHGVWGCHHHQDNLEVLCIPCHKAETKRQHAEGELK